MCVLQLWPLDLRPLLVGGTETRLAYQRGPAICHSRSIRNVPIGHPGPQSRMPCVHSKRQLSRHKLRAISTSPYPARKLGRLLRGMRRRVTSRGPAGQLGRLERGLSCRHTRRDP
jgi:hypothetical protein